MIDFRCTSCGKSHSVKDDFAGKRGKCVCGNIMVVPELIANPQNIITPPVGTLKHPELQKVNEDRPNKNIIKSQSTNLASGESLYIKDNFPQDHFPSFCENCKSVFQEDSCKKCGFSLWEGTEGRNDCNQCHTGYSGSRNCCPVCEVGENLEKAQDPNLEPQKGLVFWQLAYDEARSKGIQFTFNDHLEQINLLTEGGQFEAARKKLSILSEFLGEKLDSSSKREDDQIEYLDKMSGINSFFSCTFGEEEREYLKENGKHNHKLCTQAIKHDIASILYYTKSLYLKNNNKPSQEQLNTWYLKKLKSTLTSIKMGKKGRPDQLFELLKKHISKLPNIDEACIEDDARGLFESWS